MKVRASSLGIRRSQHKPKRFLRKLVNYLKSDSYMFASVVSSSTLKRKYGLSPRKRFHVNAAGLEMVREGDDEKEKKNKRSVEMIGEYMRSDSYMYAPLIRGECSGVAPKETVDPATEGAPYLTKKVSTSTARTVQTMETHYRQTLESRHSKEEGQTKPFLITNHELDNAGDQIPKKSEMLKHFLLPNCWTSFLPESDFADNSSIAERVVHRRKIAVE